MNWGQFKKFVENEGVKDDNEIESIAFDYSLGATCVKIEDGVVIITDIYYQKDEDKKKFRDKCLAVGFDPGV